MRRLSQPSSFGNLPSGEGGKGVTQGGKFTKINMLPQVLSMLATASKKKLEVAYLDSWLNRDEGTLTATYSHSI